MIVIASVPVRPKASLSSSSYLAAPTVRETQDGPDS